MSATTLSREEERRLNKVARTLRGSLERELNIDGTVVMVSKFSGNAYECKIPSDMALPADGLAVLSEGVTRNGLRMELNSVTAEARNLRFTVSDVETGHGILQ